MSKARMRNGNRFGRRGLLAVLAASPVMFAQSPAGVPPPGSQPAPQGPDKLQQARDSVRHNSEQLSRMEVALDLQPAFSFRP